jgi:hypothetical protein
VIDRQCTHRAYGLRLPRFILALVPSDRAVNFTRGQSIRRLLLSLLLLASGVDGYLKAADPRSRLWAVAAILIFLAGVVSFTPNVTNAPEQGQFHKTFRVLSGLLGLAALVLAAGYELSRPSLWEHIQAVYKRLSLYIGPPLNLVGTAFLAAIAYGFFVLKTKKLIIYAWTEIVFALISCYVAISRARNGLSIGTVIVIGAAIYLTVRGLDNRKKAIAERSNT